MRRDGKGGELFRVLVRIWHSGEGRMVEPGKVVSLDHLTRKERQLLVSMGAVAPVKGEEVKDDGTGSDG